MKESILTIPSISRMLDAAKDRAESLHSVETTLMVNFRCGARRKMKIELSGSPEAQAAHVAQLGVTLGARMNSIEEAVEDEIPFWGKVDLVAEN